MIRFLERQYVKFMLMRIARHNKVRKRFEDKYEELFGDYGEDLSDTFLIRCKEINGGLAQVKDGELRRITDNKVQEDDLGITEYVLQYTGHCEDDFYGTTYRKSLIPGLWIRTPFNCW